MQTVLNETFTVALAGDSIWGCDIETVTVNKIIIETYEEDVEEGIDYKTIWVEHDGGEGSWRMYTDSGFEEAISERLGERVMFTEQGMQEDGVASMEA